MKRRILRHMKRVAPRRRSTGSSVLIEAVSRHVQRYVGPIHGVFHDLHSDAVHVDLLWVPPHSGRPFHTIVTCGMAEQPMAAPADWTGCRRAELLLRLPREWQLELGRVPNPRFRWPLQELEHLARFPHVFETFLWENHTVAGWDPPQPLSRFTSFCGSLLTCPSWLPPSFHSLHLDTNCGIHFFSVVPLHAGELIYAREAGSERLLEELRSRSVSDLLDERRPDACPRAGGYLPVN